MSDKQRGKHARAGMAGTGGPRRGCRILAGVVAFVALGQGAAGMAGPLDDGGARVARFVPEAAFPPVLAGRLQGAASSLHVATVPQGTLYVVTDANGKARVWLARNNAIVAELSPAASRPQMVADWSGSFAFGLGNLPVVAISWKFAPGNYGIEDYAFWAAEGSGRFLGGLPGGTRSACGSGEPTPGKDCARCSAASGIPIDLKISGVERDRARFVQQRAATWYYHFGAAAEVFEQDFVLTAAGLLPDGPVRRTRNIVPLPQAKEQVKPLLRDYFRLAKQQSRESIASEFLTCFEQMVDLSPDFGQGYYNVGCMHALLGNHKDAVAAISKALTLEPSYRKLARRDPDLASVRADPEIVRLLGEPAK
jgi:hypothetical protein